jgi:hypothetical protein
MYRCEHINIPEDLLVSTVGKHCVKKWGLHRRHHAVHIRIAIVIRLGSYSIYDSNLITNLGVLKNLV